ncbi:MAG: NAD-dependent epimerase/dehydratase family protein [Bacteroidales bacterium]|nr:NAD-dependent epimerase/dehydratase family protein [Bacteroidales bacterium]MCM1148363.1 NAD-dependent epimerase/dehydratase family protein [Bacteroidales bacterium]MCM1207036.1 NAD-dependent epimerase/dehydratase family protein [Bacillota bacterium]MCM1511307.1 NAD-dependent epimerase/dehydratase family protein [Clostridium sp.]
MMNKKHPQYLEDIRNVLGVKGIGTLRGKSVLVTGATGLIGVHLIDVLMMLGDVKVCAVGRDRGRAAERLGDHFSSPLFSFLEQDVTQPFPENICADFIIPCASNTHPLAYSRYPAETMLVNLKGAEHALELALRCGATVLYPSTVEVYGNAREGDTFTEDYTGMLNLATSRACYSESKRSCEALCQSYAAEYGVSVRIARLSRVFGPTMLMSDSKASSQFIRKALDGEDIVLKSEGNQFFSYTYVADAVAAMLHIMLNGEDGTAYNIANDSCNVHLRDFAGLCAELCGRDVVFDLPSESERKGFSVATTAILDTSRLRDSGFSPIYDMKDAVARTIHILKND